MLIFDLAQYTFLCIYPAFVLKVPRHAFVATVVRRKTKASFFIITITISN